MKKRLLLLLTAFAMVASLTACGGKEDAVEDSGEGSASWELSSNQPPAHTIHDTQTNWDVLPGWNWCLYHEK